MAKRTTVASEGEETLEPVQAQRVGSTFSTGPSIPGAVKVTNVETTTRRYVEPPTAEPELVEDEEEWLPEDEALADFIGSGQNYMIRIEQISDAYASSGQTSLRTAPGTWCDDIPLTPDYRQIIRSAFGPGVYRLLLKENGKIRRHHILKIAPPAGAMVTTSGPGQSHIRVMQGQQIDPIEMFRSQTLLVREFMKLSHELMPEQPIVNPGASPELALQIAEQSGKLKLMETLLVHPDKELSERLLTKLFPGDDDKSSSIWPELIELGKVGLQLLSDSGLLKTLAGQPAAQPDTTATASAAAPADSELRTPNPAQLSPDQRSPSQIAYARAIDIVRQGMYFDDMPPLPLAALDQLIGRWEEWGPEIDTMMLAREPAVVVETLIANTGLAQAPDDTKAHWAGWIARLQEQWKSEPADPERLQEPDAEQS